MAMVCDNCGQAWLDNGHSDQGAGWWRMDHHLITTQGSAVLRDQRDFCSQECVRAYYTQPDGAPTTRLPAVDVAELSKALARDIRR